MNGCEVESELGDIFGKRKILRCELGMEGMDVFDGNGRCWIECNVIRF